MKLQLPIPTGVRLIDTKNIISFEAEGNQTRFIVNRTVPADRNPFFISTKSLKETEIDMPEVEFFKCKKDYFINLLYLSEYDTSEDIIDLENRTEIKIAREQKARTK